VANIDRVARVRIGVVSTELSTENVHEKRVAKLISSYIVGKATREAAPSSLRTECYGAHLHPNEPPAYSQVIVWAEDRGKPFLRGIYDQVFLTTARHATYREFVTLYGKQAAETAVRLYRMEQDKQ